MDAASGGGKLTSHHHSLMSIPNAVKLSMLNSGFISINKFSSQFSLKFPVRSTFLTNVSAFFRTLAHILERFREAFRSVFRTFGSFFRTFRSFFGTFGSFFLTFRLFFRTFPGSVSLFFRTFPGSISFIFSNVSGERFVNFFERFLGAFG
jgi:hypothetical protein